MNEMQFLKDLEYVRTGGSEKELKAAEYIKKNLEDLGLKPKIENFPVQAAEILECSLEVIEPYREKIDCKGFVCAGDTAGLTGDLYYYRGREGSCHDVKDKIVLFDTNIGYWTYKSVFEEGAKGIICCNGNLLNDSEDIDQKELREPLREVGQLPMVEINVSDAFKMVQNGALKVKMVLKQKPSKAHSRNVVCKIAGKRKPAIVFTAHYDSTPLSKGSYDNATGSLGIFKLAEYFAENKPEHDLIFVFCGSEERGLLGSKAYVKKHKKELEDIGLNINLDMIGSAMGGFIACATAEDRLVYYVEYLAKEKGFPLNARQGVYSSDSTPFADNGIPAISFARLTQYSPIHNRFDDTKMLNEAMIKKDIEFIKTFTLRMDQAIFLPVERKIPDKMKEELDYYLLRKKKENN